MASNSQQASVNTEDLVIPALWWFSRPKVAPRASGSLQTPTSQVCKQKPTAQALSHAQCLVIYCRPDFCSSWAAGSIPQPQVHILPQAKLATANLYSIPTHLGSQHTPMPDQPLWPQPQTGSTEPGIWTHQRQKNLHRPSIQAVPAGPKLWNDSWSLVSGSL